jgi:hypothetical protein
VIHQLHDVLQHLLCGEVHIVLYRVGLIAERQALAVIPEGGGIGFIIRIRWQKESFKKLRGKPLLRKHEQSAPFWRKRLNHEPIPWPEALDIPLVPCVQQNRARTPVQQSPVTCPMAVVVQVALLPPCVCLGVEVVKCLVVVAFLVTRKSGYEEDKEATK